MWLLICCVVIGIVGIFVRVRITQSKVDSGKMTEEEQDADAQVWGCISVFILIFICYLLLVKCS